jgi:hypothetical protein
MVMLERHNRPLVAVPVYSKLTKVASVVAVERVAVRVATPAAFSAIAVVPVRVTVGTDCSSVMVTVAESGVPIVVPFPPLTDAIV